MLGSFQQGNVAVTLSVPAMNKFIACVCFILALVTGSAAFWMHMKSIVGQVLLSQAWQNTLESGKSHRAWPWADTWPVAELELPKTEKSWVILEGVSGEAMAFGPGRVSSSSMTASAGTYVIGGHRDSHLNFLEHIAIGETLRLHTADGAKTRYRISELFIADSDLGPLNLPKNMHALVLITCYPFNALQTGGPLRYVVIAVPEEEINLSV